MWTRDSRECEGVEVLKANDRSLWERLAKVENKFTSQQMKRLSGGRISSAWSRQCPPSFHSVTRALSSCGKTRSEHTGREELGRTSEPLSRTESFLERLDGTRPSCQLCLINIACSCRPNTLFRPTTCAAPTPSAIQTKSIFCSQPMCTSLRSVHHY